jgi:hypothetical protein
VHCTKGTTSRAYLNRSTACFCLALHPDCERILVNGILVMFIRCDCCGCRAIRPRPAHGMAALCLGGGRTCCKLGRVGCIYVEAEKAGCRFGGLPPACGCRVVIFLVNRRCLFPWTNASSCGSARVGEAGPVSRQNSTLYSLQHS